MNEKLSKIANSNTTIRRGERFVAVNLATLSENLIESELFGHERGSFSGADSKRIGKLEWANKGTVFLDEIGELPIHIQAKLLEALNSRIVIPVGSNREIQLDIRIIAATNRPLDQMVAEGKFRQDLYYRIKGFQIHLPKLQGNNEKIEGLARTFAHECAQNRNQTCWKFGEGFMACLLAHSWPGNVRELRNTIEYAFALCSDGILLPEHLPPLHSSSSDPMVENYLFPSNYRSAKESFERKYLEHILRRFEGKINLTAKESGLSKVTLIEKIRKYEINIPEIKYQSHLNKIQQRTFL